MIYLSRTREISQYLVGNGSSSGIEECARRSSVYWQVFSNYNAQGLALTSILLSASLSLTQINIKNKLKHLISNI